MERLELYKGFRLRAYEDWWGQWFAEARKFSDTDWIATPSGHSAPEAAITFLKQMIDSPSTQLTGQRQFNSMSRASR
jgi:hypothetical protein